MKPMQKLGLLVLVVYIPYVLAPLYVVTGHHPMPRWFILPWLGYTAGFASLMRHVKRHPTLQPSPEERAKRLAMMNPRKAKAWTIVFLAAILAAGLLLLFFQREPPSNLVCAQGIARARTQWGIYRGVAWVNVVLTLAMFLRLYLVSYRKRKARLAGSNLDVSIDG